MGLEGPIFFYTRPMGLNNLESINNNLDTSKWMDQVEALAESIAKSESCYLYDLEFSGSGAGRTLTVFIDKDAVTEDGVGAGIEDCSNVSKALNEVLDSKDIIPGGPYLLEVSTPGLDRNLKKLWHFEKVVGKKIWLRTALPLESYGVQMKEFAKAKTVEKVLKEVKDGQLFFDAKEGILSFPFSAVEKSKVVFEMNKGQKKNRR